MFTGPSSQPKQQFLASFFYWAVFASQVILWSLNIADFWMLAVMSCSSNLFKNPLFFLQFLLPTFNIFVFFDNKQHVDFRCCVFLFVLLFSFVRFVLFVTVCLTAADGPSIFINFVLSFSLLCWILWLFSLIHG
jgi:hypothetical protein